MYTYHKEDSVFTEEHIIKVLKEREAGIPVKDTIRKYGISDQTYYWWKSKFGGLEVSEAKELEVENRRLKQMVADLMLDNKVLRDVILKKLVKPAEKRRAADYAVVEHELGMTRAVG